MLESYQIQFNIHSGFKKHNTQLKPLGEHEILVAPLATGICGSDLYLIHKAQNIELNQLILGHEWYGRILKVGAQVQSLAVGDLVTGTGHLACGHCEHCKLDLTNLCEKISHFSSNHQGSLVQHIQINEFDVLKIPLQKNNSSLALVLLEIFSIGEEAYSLAVKNNFKMSDTTHLVFGAGPIGLAVAEVLKSYGQQSLLVDVDFFRVENANQHGLKAILLQEALLSETLKNSFVSVFDCSNDYNSKTGGFKFLNYFTKKSYHVLMVGKYLTGQILTDSFNSKQAHLVFMRGTSKKTLAQTLAKWTAKLSDLAPQFITHQFDLAQTSEAFEKALSQKNCVKVVIKNESL